MYPINEPQLLLASASEAFDSDLRLKDELARKTLKTVLQKLVYWAEKIKSE